MSRGRLAAGVAAVLVVLVLAVGLWWWLGRSKAPREGREGTPASPDGEGMQMAVELYFPSLGTTLGRESRDLAVEDDPQRQLAALAAALMEGPSAPSLVPPMPPGVTVRGVSMGDEGIVYVDLVSEDGSPPPSGGATEERLRVYSLVNTLVLNVAEARSAVLLWNGTQPQTFSGHLDLSRPLRPDASLVERQGGGA